MRPPSSLMKSTTVPDKAPLPVDPGPPETYLDLYGLSKPPFSGTPEQGRYTLFGTHRRALELVSEHVATGSGMILLQGEQGVGKTATLRSVAAAAAESGVRTIVVSTPPNGRISLMQLLSALGGRPSAEEATADGLITQFLAPPRKALLADDLDLMPADCVRLLLTLAQRTPNDRGAPAIVLSTSADLMLMRDPKRPELGELVSLASNTVRLSRLDPTEIRQYIERSFWIAGGTTRRLITPDAMKVIIAQTNGVPGTTNRLMEAVLTAGFARGDPMITEKTVAAAMGPTAPRSRYRASQPSDMAGQLIQIAGIGLLVLGASAFLYRGLSEQAGLGVSASRKLLSSALSQAPPVGTISKERPPVAATVPEQPPAAKPAGALPPELVAALMKRGDQAFGFGDVAAARLLYQRAAESGDGPAATALGRTYDPMFAAPGGKPDPARASEWYQKAIMLGDPHAADLLMRLGGPQHVAPD